MTRGERAWVNDGVGQACARSWRGRQGEERYATAMCRDSKEKQKKRASVYSCLASSVHAILSMFIPHMHAVHYKTCLAAMRETMVRSKSSSSSSSSSSPPISSGACPFPFPSPFPFCCSWLLPPDPSLKTSRNRDRRSYDRGRAFKCAVMSCTCIYIQWYVCGVRGKRGRVCGHGRFWDGRGAPSTRALTPQPSIRPEPNAQAHTLDILQHSIGSEPNARTGRPLTAAATRATAPGGASMKAASTCGVLGGRRQASGRG